MKRRWRWVTRDSGTGFIKVWASHLKPDKNDLGDYRGGGFVTVCCDEFKLATGIKIKPSECLKVEFSAKVVER